MTARGTSLGLLQPDENEPWTIHIQLKPDAEPEKREPRRPREPEATAERDDAELDDDTE